MKFPVNAFVCTDGWAGRIERLVKVIGETPTRYRIEALMDTRLPRRSLDAGERTLVPKRAVRFVPESGAEHG